MLGSVVRTLRSLFSFYFIIIIFFILFCLFSYYCTYDHHYYYYFCILIMISSLLASGVRVGRLCWVGQEPVVLAAGGRPTNLDNGRARAYYVCSRCESGLFEYFFLSPIISLFLFPSL